MSKKCPEYIMNFMKAVYPNNTKLAIASFNEKAALQDATRTITSLRTAIDKQPKTADGVTLVPGVELWSKPDSDGNCSVGRRWIMDESGTVWYGTMLRHPAGDPGSSLPQYYMEGCYSTREAAETARNKT